MVKSVDGIFTSHKQVEKPVEVIDKAKLEQARVKQAEARKKLREFLADPKNANATEPDVVAFLYRECYANDYKAQQGASLFLREPPPASQGLDSRLKHFTDPQTIDQSGDGLPELEGIPGVNPRLFGPTDPDQP